MKRIIPFAFFILLNLTAFLKAEQGNPKITGIDALAFGPDGLLLIANGPRVVIVATGDVKKTTWTKNEIPKVDQIFAGKLGLQPADMEIRKIAVNPASMKAYVLVRALTMKTNVILAMDGAGGISEFSLENVRFKSYALKTPDVAITKATDIAWAGGKIIVSTQATDKFASRGFTIDPTDKSGAPIQVSTKTYHVGHNKWETEAPLRAIMPLVEAGKTSVVGAFTCAPMVRYDIEEVKANEQVTGRSILELGPGNTPRSMFSYERGGTRFVLVNVATNNKKPAAGFPSAYWTARVDAGMLNETTNINENALWRAGRKNPAGERVQVVDDYSGVQQMDRVDSTRALAIMESDGGLALRVLQLP